MSCVKTLPSILRPGTGSPFGSLVVSCLVVSCLALLTDKLREPQEYPFHTPHVCLHGITSDPKPSGSSGESACGTHGAGLGLMPKRFFSTWPRKRSAVSLCVPSV